MRRQLLGPDQTGSWTFTIGSSRLLELMPKVTRQVWGVGLLYYRPKQQITACVWGRTWSRAWVLWSRSTPRPIEQRTYRGPKENDFGNWF